MRRHRPVRSSVLVLVAVALAGCASSSSTLRATSVASPVPSSGAPASSAAPDGAQTTASTPSSATNAGAPATTAAATSASSTSSTTAAGAAPGKGTPFCSTVGEIDDLSSSGLVVNAGNAKTVLTRIDGLYQQLKRDAPAAIAADVTTLADLSKRQYEIMARNDFDGDKVETDADFAATRAASQDPAVAAAGRRVGAYALAQCGIDLKAFTTA